MSEADGEGSDLLIALGHNLQDATENVQTALPKYSYTVNAELTDHLGSLSQGRWLNFSKAADNMNIRMLLKQF